MTVESLAWSIPFWPLLGAIAVGLLLAIRAPARLAPLPVILGCAASALLAIGLFQAIDASTTHHGDPHSAHAEPAHDDEPHGAAAADAPHYTLVTLFQWISLGIDAAGRQTWIPLNFYVDGLTGVMLLTVCVVSLLVVIYSVGYMRDHHGHPERGYERFFAFLGMFVFSMCMLVLAGNFVLLYLGWELVGLCSYLLIGFYYPKPEAAAAAKKAFIVNRIGDFGFAVGIFALYVFLRPHLAPGENPLDYDVVFAHVRAGALSTSQLTTVALLLFCGAVGKSAQLPLYVWLPDAMEGPSPVSALIHAATMVTAGVYMVARCGPIFAGSPIALDVVAIVGVAGALFAATMAMAQFDMKRILAYSTMSQLAYMFVALGCLAPASGVFHLFTHAFFKALLFLGAGSVMHSMGNIIDVRRFSGLRAVLPRTYVLMLIGCLALAGFPFLAGFWSKDEIVHAAFYSDLGHRMPWLGPVLLLVSGLTAYYTFRMFFLCFHGPLRLPREAGEHPHDAPPVMFGPMAVLAVGAVFAGYLGVSMSGPFGDKFLGLFAPHGYFHHYLHASTLVSGPHHAGGMWLMYVSALIAIAGIGVAWMRYAQAPVADPDERALGAVWRLWHAKYYVDELYDRVFVEPLRRLGYVFWGLDRFFIDGLIWFIAAIPQALGALARLLQRGALQGYASAMALGTALLALLWTYVETAD